MNDRWLPRYNPDSGRVSATVAERGRSAAEREPSENSEAEERWPTALRLLFMIGAAALCWVILGLLVYLLW
jgi:hypothetical protein